MHTLTLLIVCNLLAFHVGGFLQHSRTAFLPRRSSAYYTSTLQGGYGVAADYTWTEEPFELEVSVSVPPGTRAKDVLFKATPSSIDLRLGDKVLLDGNRTMRGRISLDGTFWVLSDEGDAVTVTIEKNVATPKDDFEVVDYDWRGVYPDDKEEVSERKYEEAEELDVREYAASLGVDIDNINMSMVDKTMFSSGLNLTKSTMDELSKAGYVQEVTQQSDGSEYIVKDGDAMPFSRLGDTVGDDELADAGVTAKIPFLDTDSPWHSAVPVDDLNVTMKDSAAGLSPELEKTIAAPDRDAPTDVKGASDPIDMLTVKRLKEILRTQGLKVSGSKQELQDRLREHVQAKLKESDSKT